MGDIFEAPEDRVPVGPNIHSSSTKVTEASRSQGPGLADLVKDRLCKVSTEGEEGSKGGGELASSKLRKRSLSRSQSEETRSRSRSRDRRKKKKDVDKPPKEKKNKL